MNSRIVSNLVMIVTHLIEALLGLRILLKFLGASTQAPFVAWMYETTQPLLSPFQGMFPSPQTTGGLNLEFSAIFALVAYAFLGYIISELIAQLEVYSSSASSNKSK